MIRDDLLRAAIDALQRAYAPYSRHPVAAAGLLGGEILVGVNVENVVNRLSVCAEQSLVSVAMSSGLGAAFEEIVVVGPTGGCLAPCGACRQLLIEHCPSGTLVNGVPVYELLPSAPVIDLDE